MFKVNNKDTNQYSHHNKTSNLIYTENQLTSYYMLVTLAVKWLKAHVINGGYQEVVLLN